MRTLMLFVVVSLLVASISAVPPDNGDPLPGPRNYPSMCPNDCSGHGLCPQPSTDVYFPPVCLCDELWKGEDCSIRRCKNECTGKGICVNGTCVCNEGWTGQDCSKRKKKCDVTGPNGQKIDCTQKMKSESASWINPPPAVLCPQNCTHHGRCEPTTGTCLCHFGWRGENCSLSPCPGSCSNHGTCIVSKPQDGDYNWWGGVCVCDEGYHGPACDLVPPPCPGNCSFRGFCDRPKPWLPGKCKCDPPWQGVDCSWANGCIPGYSGGMGTGCKADCSCHGICINGQCSCEPGYASDDCSVQIPTW